MPYVCKYSFILGKNTSFAQKWYAGAAGRPPANCAASVAARRFGVVGLQQSIARASGLKPHQSSPTSTPAHVLGHKK